MKFSVLLLPVLAIIAFSSCKEKNTNVEFGNKVIEDSTYVSSSVEAAQQHNVLVEEFTGANCVNCPGARTILHNASEANDHRLIVMAIHIFGDVSGEPVPGKGKYDLRTEKGNSIKNLYYEYSGMPSAGFDRSVKEALSMPKWANAITTRLDKKTPVNVTLSSSYDEASHKANVEVKIAYTEEVTGNHRLSVVLVEDSIIDVQKTLDDKEIPEYVNLDILRDFVTAVNGDEFLQDLPKKEAGRTFIRTFRNIDIKPEWKAKNCKIIAFIHYDEADNKEVIQATEVHLGE